MRVRAKDGVATLPQFAPPAPSPQPLSPARGLPGVAGGRGAFLPFSLRVTVRYASARSVRDPRAHFGFGSQRVRGAAAQSAVTVAGDITTGDTRVLWYSSRIGADNTKLTRMFERMSLARDRWYSAVSRLAEQYGNPFGRSSFPRIRTAAGSTAAGAVARAIHGLPT
jgi:hypothetical protein